ncbi:MAG: EthD family reductase [Frankiaceae bacterium]
MLKFVALYRSPGDPADFDRHYFGEHVPLVNQTPGLVRAEVAKVTRMMVGEPAYYVLAELYFDDLDAFKAGTRSDAWVDSGKNLQEWGGMELVTMFTAQVVDDAGDPA